MTAAALLERFWARGIEVSTNGDRLTLRPASALSAEEVAQAKALKPEIIRLLALSPASQLRQAYRQVFELNVAEVDGHQVSPADAERLHQRILKLTDEAGTLAADAILTDEVRRFRQQTGRCGYCGGPPHEREGDA